MNSYDQIIKEKYRDKLIKSFDLKINYFLFDRIIKTKNFYRVSLVEFQNFEITDDLVSLYNNASKVLKGKFDNKIELTIEDIDVMITDWDESYKEQEKEFALWYEKYYEENVYPISKFKELYPKDISKRICEYCGLSEKDISELKKQGLIRTKNRRGSVLEFDRHDSNYEYKQGNVVLACYWCNNAKTDEFTYDEFKDIIGPAIKNVWKERIE
jgi:hypothetical protein